MDWTVIVAIAFGLIAVITVLRATGRSASKGESAPLYEANGGLLTPAERSFFGVLEQAIGSDLRVFAKVRVADVLRPRKGMPRSEWQTAFNKISAKHFDFVLCDPQTLGVKAIVELNDKSHKAKRRAARDEFLRSACEDAQVNLIEVQAKRGYAVEELRAVLPAQGAAE